MFVAYVDLGIQRAVEALAGVTTADAVALGVLLSLLGAALTLADLTTFTIVEITVIVAAGLVSQIVVRLATAEMTLQPTDAQATPLKLSATGSVLNEVRYALVTGVRLDGRALSPRRA